MEELYGLTAGGGYQWLGAGEERLDRALVAGLMLDAALGPAALPQEPLARGRVLKTRVEEALLSHLAGRITLDRFRTLINTLEQSFSFYLPLISNLLLKPEAGPAAQRHFPKEPPLSLSNCQSLHRDLLAAAISDLRGVLPHRPRSKLTGDKLQDFLGRTRGGWFRLGDFQEYFGVDRKTAWEYVQKFLHHGLLSHNAGRAAAVRYALNDKFLRVRGEAIRSHAAGALAGLAPHLAVQVGDRLITNGGEPFWEAEWRGSLPAALFQEILQRLTTPGSLLEVVSCPDGTNRLLRLQACWLQSPHPPS